MKVKDIVICSLKILGRGELASLLSEDGEMSAEERDTVNTLVHCFNAVEDEVARCYVPLLASDTVKSAKGEFAFSSLAHTPVRITRILSGGEGISYKLFPDCIKADATEITVEYDYAPSIKTIDGVSDFNCAAGEYLFACGAAAEYCLINGEIQAAEVWESKYRQEIESVQRKSTSSGAYIPPRRWV